MFSHRDHLCVLCAAFGPEGGFGRENPAERITALGSVSVEAKFVMNLVFSGWAGVLRPRQDEVVLLQSTS